MPKISIIVPVYKAEKYLRRCLDSIVAQTFTDWECILVDDGSPDNSGKICDEYAEKDKRFKVFHQENAGVSAARQKGLNNCIGDFVIHTDPDDWIEKNMLEDMITHIRFSNCDLLIVDYYRDKHSESKISMQKPTTDTSISLLHDILKGKLHGSCCNKMIRKNLIDKYNVKFIYGLSFCEDVMFWAQILQHPLKISYLDKAFYHYTILNNSLSTCATKNHIVQRIKFVESLENIIDKQEFSEEITRRKLINKLVAFKTGFYSNDEIYALHPEINCLRFNIEFINPIDKLLVHLIVQKHIIMAHLLYRIVKILCRIKNAIHK
ncbi:MAG: glycosyltransferase [Alphaproteobacteria bacterium]|nr:glycosyltransferase [Alphaproteobacteria bacterium]